MKAKLPTQKFVMRFILITLSFFVALALFALLFIKLSPSVSLDDVMSFFRPQVAYEPAPSLNLVQFDYVEIDSGISGDIKLVGDLDRDGYPDLVIGGMPSEKLNWYRYPDWLKTEIATPVTEFTTDGALGDVDGDGDLDIVLPDGNQGDNLVWFENPLPASNPAAADQWKRKPIGAVGGWGKDVELADFDQDGTLDVAVRSHNQAMIFFQSSPGTWLKTALENVTLGQEGMASGDIDHDGAVDLVLRGVWLRNPAGPEARDPTEWRQYTIGDAPENFKALVVDLNQDGRNDILYSSSEDVADVNWWTPSSSSPTGEWQAHTILPSLEKAHTLQAADMDLDGDLDVILAQMHTSPQKEIVILYNIDGKATSWQRQLVDVGGLHNGVVADIGSDGDYDLFGANWTGNPPVKLYLNRSEYASSLDHWTYIQVTDKHTQTFGLAFGDVDYDSHLDILSGQYWYHNPGGDLESSWEQVAFPEGMQAILTVNVDGDDRFDVIAQKDESEIALYWLESSDPNWHDWDSVKIGVVPRASHALGAQGYRTAQIEAGGRPEVLISSGEGIYYFRIPDQPETGNWPRTHVNASPSDEGFAAGDIDQDGAVDIAATTGNAKGVAWYQNPGDGSENWTAFSMGTFPEAEYPDRTEVADLDGDGWLDIIVSEENGQDQDAQTYWWVNPAGATQDHWNRNLVTSQATTNSMDSADMDQDGDTDLVLGEHRGAKKLSIWVNDGGNLSEKVISTGYESHLGSRTVDLDGDGDLDIVSIAWDDYQLIHLWRNDSETNPPAESIPETPTPTADLVPSPSPTAEHQVIPTQSMPTLPASGEQDQPEEVAEIETTAPWRIPKPVSWGLLFLVLAAISFWIMRKMRSV